jgi:hypothetical protein
LQDFRFTFMGAVRRANAGQRQTVKPFNSVGWHHSSKVVATELIKFFAKRYDFSLQVEDDPGHLVGTCRSSYTAPTEIPMYPLKLA